MYRNLLEHLEQVLTTTIKKHRTIGGGDINDAWALDTVDGQFFVKLNQHQHGLALLSTEVKGLELLTQNSNINTPKIIHCGEYSGVAYLILEYIVGGAKTGGFWQDFGAMLAHLHQQPQESFGLPFDNFIGTLPQSNRSHPSGVDFIIQERFLPQIKMATDQGLMNKQDHRLLDRLCQQLPHLIPEEAPALIHGDLWSGNYMTGEGGIPILIDPAVGRTSREFDIAMSQLFGGFAPAFYDAYQDAYPLQAGWQDRIDIFQLYYLLAHVNMFGGGYVQSVRSILQRYS